MQSVQAVTAEYQRLPSVVKANAEGYRAAEASSPLEETPPPDAGSTAARSLRERALNMRTMSENLLIEASASEDVPGLDGVSMTTETLQKRALQLRKMSDDSSSLATESTMSSTTQTLQKRALNLRMMSAELSSLATESGISDRLADVRVSVSRRGPSRNRWSRTKTFLDQCQVLCGQWGLSVCSTNREKPKNSEHGSDKAPTDAATDARNAAAILRAAAEELDHLIATAEAAGAREEMKRSSPRRGLASAPAEPPAGDENVGVGPGNENNAFFQATFMMTSMQEGQAFTLEALQAANTARIEASQAERMAGLEASEAGRLAMLQAKDLEMHGRLPDVPSSSEEDDAEPEPETRVTGGFVENPADGTPAEESVEEMHLFLERSRLRRGVVGSVSSSGVDAALGC